MPIGISTPLGLAVFDLFFPLLKMLELAVAEIQHQDERVWTMKQDEHNQPV